MLEAADAAAGCVQLEVGLGTAVVLEAAAAAAGCVQLVVGLGTGVVLEVAAAAGCVQLQGKLGPIDGETLPAERQCDPEVVPGIVEVDYG